MSATVADKCTQCGTLRHGPYCHQCGQLHSGQKASLLLLLRESLATFFSLERSGLATVIQLLRRPATIVNTYIEGNRGYYQHPNKLLFYALVVYGLHFTLVDSYVLNLSFELEGATPSLIFMAIVLPFLSVTSWLVFNPRKYDFADHLVANSYFVSIWFILITIIGDLIDWIYPREWDSADILVFLFLTSYSTSRVFSFEKPWFKKVLLALAQIVTFCLLILFVVALIYMLGGRVKQA